MKLKPGVSLKGIQPETAIAMFVVDGVYKRVAGIEMTVTAGTDGVHKEGSLHYVGLAFDSRTKDVSPEKLDLLLQEIRTALGGMEFDIVMESDHLHCEFQPKH
jgi:uncharacterized protein YcbK (DUF882 family)